MNDEELVNSLEFEAKKHIPLDGTEAVMDYHILGQNTKELDKINVLLFATTKNLINQHNVLKLRLKYYVGFFVSQHAKMMDISL